MNLSNILDNKLDKDFLVQLFQEQTEVYQAAIQIAMTKQKPQAWRATWILKHCTKKNDARIQPYIYQFIKTIPNKEDGHQRELLNILDKMKLNEEQEGRLFDICMNLWENMTKSSSVRHISFKYLYKTCNKYPELKSELEFICQERYLENLSPGIQRIISTSIKNLVDSSHKRNS